MSGCLAAQQGDLQPGWEGSDSTGEAPSGGHHSHFQWLFTTYLCSQTMRAGSGTNGEMQNTCWCAHCRTSSEFGICTSICMCTCTARLYTQTYFKGHFVKASTGKVWRVFWWHGDLAFLRYTSTLSRCSGAVSSIALVQSACPPLLNVGRYTPPLSTLAPCIPWMGARVDEVSECLAGLTE